MKKMLHAIHEFFSIKNGYVVLPSNIQQKRNYSKNRSRTPIHNGLINHFSYLSFSITLYFSVTYLLPCYAWNGKLYVFKKCLYKLLCTDCEVKYIQNATLLSNRIALTTIAVKAIILVIIGANNYKQVKMAYNQQFILLSVLHCLFLFLFLQI